MDITANGFWLHIGTTNAAFTPDPEPEVIRLLGNTINRIESGSSAGALRDINGNTVGWFSSGEGDPADQPGAGEMVQLIEQVSAAAYGDSNDREIELLQRLVDLALTRWPGLSREMGAVGDASS